MYHPASCWADQIRFRPPRCQSAGDGTLGDRNSGAKREFIFLDTNVFSIPIWEMLFFLFCNENRHNYTRYFSSILKNRENLDRLYLGHNFEKQVLPFLGIGWGLGLRFLNLVPPDRNRPTYSVIDAAGPRPSALSAR